ncbi:MAG: DUF3857 domain-containing protein [Undibacterium sp.]|nr:DUF3857 domain-containing protein [Undibacterium sp.]
MLSLIGHSSCQAKENAFFIKPVESWVLNQTPELITQNLSNQVSRGVYYLLSDHQVRVETNSKSVFRHIAVKALNPQGLEQVGHVEIWFDPSYQTLSLHSIVVHRNGKTFQKLDKNKVKILQREKELEYRVYDGSKTANVFLEDIRVGDIVEYAYTLSGINPVFNNHQFGSFDLQMGVPIDKIFSRLLVPSERNIHFTYLNTKDKPSVKILGNEREYIWKKNQVTALVLPSETPSWHDPYPYVQWSEFKNWNELANWAVQYYKIPEKLSPNLQTVVHKIEQTHKTSLDRVLATLQFVQKEIRYLGVEIGANSHAPNPPDLVFQRRFGDCKDKALLTLSLLSALGIEAKPALVNTSLQKGIAQFAPTPFVFNHVIVHLNLSGKEFWIDPTRAMQNGDASHLYQPNYDLALIVDANSQALTPMSRNASQLQKRKIHSLIDSREGIEKPSLYTVTTVFEGGSAENMRNMLATENLDDLQKRYLNYYARYYPSIEISAPLSVSEDSKKNTLTISEYYRVPQFWSRNEEKKRFNSSLYAPDIEALLTRPSQVIRQTPLALAHPIELDQITEVLLPSHWDIKKEDNTIKDDAFELHHEINSIDNTVTMRDQYVSKADHINADETAKYVENLELARGVLGYSLWHTDAAQSKPVPNKNYTFIEKFNWAVALLALMFTAYWISLATKLYRYDLKTNPIPANNAADNSPTGINGWLIFPMLGIVVTPCRILFALSDCGIYSAQSWTSITSVGNENYYALQAPFLLFELAGNLASLVFSALLLPLFFQKRTTLPRAYVGIFGIIFAFQLIDLIIGTAVQSMDSGVLKDEWISWIRSLVSYLLWSWYFMKSVRVKNTFIRKRKSSTNTKNEHLVSLDKEILLE